MMASESDTKEGLQEENSSKEGSLPDLTSENYEGSSRVKNVNFSLPMNNEDEENSQGEVNVPDDLFDRPSFNEVGIRSQMSLNFPDVEKDDDDDDDNDEEPTFDFIEREKSRDDSGLESVPNSRPNSAKPLVSDNKKDAEETEEQNGLDNIDEESIDIDFWTDTFIPEAPTSELPLPQLPESSENFQVSPVNKDNHDIEEGVINEASNDRDDDARINHLLEKIPDYVSVFSQNSKPKEMTLSRVPQDLVVQQMKEREEVEAKMRYSELDKVKKIEGDLLFREHVARQRIQELEDQSRQRIKVEKEKMHVNFVEREYKLERDFKRAREDMESYLRQKEAVLKEEVGDLEQGKESIGRRFKVDWNMAPQPVEMRVHTLRAAKNKLARGAYCLMLTQYDRLGGRPLCWSKLGAYGIGPTKPATTTPFKHFGRYFDRTLHVEDSVFALCPPRPELKPSFIFVIELFQLANRNNPVDKVVAWTALPMINTQFTIVSGKIRLPLFRGEPSPSVEHFKTIEQLIADDLNNWLCNIYVEFRHLPRLESFKENAVDNAQGEFEVEFDFMSKLLHLNNEDKGKKDSDNEEEDFKRPSVVAKSSTVYRADKELFHRKLYKKRQKEKDKQQQSIENSSKGQDSMLSQCKIEGGIDESEEPGGVGGDESSDSDEEKDPLQKTREKVVYERPYANGEEYSLHDFQKGKLMGIETLNNEKSRQWAASGIEKGGNIVRRVQADGSRFDSEAIPPRHALKKLNRGIDAIWTTPLTEQRHYDEYSMSLAPDPGQQKKLLPSAVVKTKLSFLYHEAFGDLLPSKFGTFDWYITSVCFVLAFWLRMYVHYVGQYLFLQAVKTPVYAFEVRVYEMIFKYMSSSVPVSVEFGLVAIGPIGVLFTFLVLIGAGKLFYKYAGVLPDSVSLFIAAFGVATMFDSLLILLIDLIMHNYHCGEVDDACKEDYTSRDCECFEGDFIKLWQRTVEDESSGVTGLILTVIVYSGTFVASAMLLYEYLVYIHKDARILDLWRRISAPSEEFFIPHDFEVSYAELTSICAKASLWKGANGQTRRLAVSEYIERDPYDLDYSAVTKHYAIYESELSGKRTLYRHFLMLPDGAIIEIFDQLSLDFSSQFKSLEKLLDKTPAQSKRPEESVFGDLKEEKV